jgi:carboxylesterase type B
VALSHGIEVFKGIPFAAPPVGELRWQPPQPVARWVGVRKAEDFGPPCIQPKSSGRLGPWTRVFQSNLPPIENCLYLNLWTTAQRLATPRPVMVWIYGGGYYFDRKIPWPPHPECGVFHSSELPYVFDNLRLLNRPWQPVDWHVAREISSYRTNFARTGNPNADSLPRWPAFDAGDFTMMQLGARMAPIQLAFPAQRRFWMEKLQEPLGFMSAGTNRLGHSINVSLEQSLSAIMLSSNRRSRPNALNQSATVVQ